MGKIVVLFIACMCWPVSANNVLYQAHAHNDYHHARPLFDALSHGFNSIEADIFLEDSQLLVAHSLDEIEPEKSLSALYLMPLWQRFLTNNGSIYANSAKPLILLVDVKTEAKATYAALVNYLQPYKPMLTQVMNGELVSGAVTIVLSGNRDIEGIFADTNRIVFIDGRLPDLGNTTSPALMPLISSRWSDNFSYNGQGEMSANEKALLAKLVQEAHSHHQQIRFWGTADVPQMWKTLAQHEVDLINTDKLAELAAFLSR
ncbi:phosphatidylinositol-specific phospholipase C/glycerophosphodiester phosphodiesterase family protein [Neptunicella marina]|uniref:Altered inheritance of mitochondria protein 6 n=1 Tax=Neptunicella marina TaxID=2125989 RepID=A0A8J6LZH5_9ALTE|nr:phosphatidylinositol-specific phospholipase C/glycerophosphodiester phosphodiesterase family protein [Neptunicella marina]MBC3766145.1 hypothetical protein [Neptunicella marina]